jgi:hypothetical protein
MKRTLLPLLAVLALAGLLVGCGSSSSSSSSTAGASASGGSGTGTAARAKLVSCLKAHGVTLPSRAGAGNRPPGGGAPGFFGGAGGGAPGAGGPAGNPKFQAAIKACGGGFPRRRLSGTALRAAIQSFVTCVGKHGYKLPAPNLSGKGSVFPANIATNAKFRAASRPCVSLLRPGGAAGGSGAPGAGAAPPSA